MIDVQDLPYLTADVPGLGGKIKSRPEDFVVEEVPLYQPGGTGTHTYVVIEKTQLTTMQAVQQIARALGRPPREIGYAGMKDADAVTRQTLSIEHVDPARVRQLSLHRIRIVSVAQHTNKLKLGHLRGNRFTINLREVDTGRISHVQEMLQVLERRGVPNYFGPQRFGARGDTWEIGRALLRGDTALMMELMLGRPGLHDYGNVLKARQLFDEGDYEAAANTWSYPFYAEKRVCWAMARSNGNAGKAMRAVDPQMKRFFISAYQSQLFNQVVARRLDSLDHLMEGDLAWRHPQGAVFKVEDVAREQPRCDAFEISPTGPLYGYRMSEPTGVPAEIEEAVLVEEGMNPAEWREGPQRVKGARRPLRFRPQETNVSAGKDDIGDYIRLEFFLESGCYATTVLREICKAETTPPEAPDVEDA